MAPPAPGRGKPLQHVPLRPLKTDAPLDLIFSVGWAGALSPDLSPASTHNLAGVIDAQTGERFNCDAGAGNLWLVTGPAVADQAEKRRLAATYGASLVDMEAAAIARLAQMRGIPFYCVKGVSDGLTDKLPDFNHFLVNGKFQTAHFTLYALLRPWYWPALVRMGENSSKASQSIAETLADFLR